MQENEKRNDDVQLLGITFPKTIGIGVIAAVLFQAGYMVWSISKYTSSIERMTDQIQATSTEINKVKSEIYTRGEAIIQFEAMRREIDLQNRINERQDAELKDLRHSNGK